MLPGLACQKSSNEVLGPRKASLPAVVFCCTPEFVTDDTALHGFPLLLLLLPVLMLMSLSNLPERTGRRAVHIGCRIVAFSMHRPPASDPRGNLNDVASLIHGVLIGFHSISPVRVHFTTLLVNAAAPVGDDVCVRP